MNETRKKYVLLSEWSWRWTVLFDDIDITKEQSHYRRSDGATTTPNDILLKKIQIRLNAKINEIVMKFLRVQK